MTRLSPAIVWPCALASCGVGGTQGLAQLRAHFGEQRFLPEGGFVLRQGQVLPPLVWEDPSSVAKVVSDPAIRTRWFSEALDEVRLASQPGRYYAYGEAPTPSGPPLRRAMTCCCVEGRLDLIRLAEETGSSVEDWRGSEKGAVVLAALLDGAPEHPRARDAQWQMENADRHVRLKRRVLGLDGAPPVTVAARMMDGPPAPVLRSGSWAEAGVSGAEVSELVQLLDDWYAEAGEPTAVVVARNGVVILARSYGQVDGEPVGIHTPMLLHSAMKPLIGLQLAMYVDRGLVHLDQPIGDFLPDFASLHDEQLTFRAGHVHVTGIHFPWELASSRLFYFRTWQDALIAHCPRDWAPGARHQYGVVGIILAVRALELLSGRNYWSAMEDEVFGPLGIADALPGGTGFSAENLARIGVLLSNHGRYGPWELFSEQTHRSILPTQLKPHFPDVDLTYGIGLRDASGSLGPGSYGHGGGCGTQLLIAPEKQLVFAMVRNEPGEGYREHLARVLGRLRRLGS